jgi:transposase
MRGDAEVWRSSRYGEEGALSFDSAELSVSKLVRRPKIGPCTGLIDAILEQDIEVPKKQGHTIQRIFDRLKDEHGFDGGYTTVRDHVRERCLVMKEAFVPLSHPPGHGHVDFGGALVVIAGDLWHLKRSALRPSQGAYHLLS